MAVDFSLLPIEKPETGKPPSLVVWIVVFLVLSLVGIFLVLMLWPKNMSTHTFDFWGTLILFPVGLSALIVLLRYQHYAARILDTQMDNQATRQYNDRVFAAASVPIAVLGVSHRFSASPDENAVMGLQSGALRLTVQALFAHDSEPGKVRWLEVPGVALRAGTSEDDLKRHIDVTRWLFNEMLGELTGAINALPVRTDLCVHLLVSSMASSESNQALWLECWNSFGFCSSCHFKQVAEPANLQLLDLWLDQLEAGLEKQAKLVVAIQLHPLMGASPPGGTAEAGVALLLMPDSLARQHEVMRRANFHRPVHGPFDLSNGAFAYALKWASSTVDEISGGWQSGLDRIQAGALRTSAVQSGLEIQPVDLDARVGYAGIAAPWLAAACSAKSLSATAPRQVVFAGQGGAIDCAVLCNISTAEPPVSAVSPVT
ncbi:hypothetical protein F4827_002315 [Paraburkholderia bannensis]|uniref:Uncharacterized protein n=1 Tax=Paraburkholderia bannensis TaxID=765414 RepID=A0A7W9TW23_9BURK|nr:MULTISPECIES: hypothetical protein [Paraburkholderia]MBB3257138.1 hypothetical protein [Paraburkholderia sp. WP4_3_2]MBB6102466.1 hypothetical protein [Paraburkholderia bannensis]